MNKGIVTQLDNPPVKRQTLWVQEGERITLAVDHRNSKALEDYFKNNKLAVQQINTHAQAGREYELGYLCYEISALHVPIGLHKKLGEPLSPEAYEQKLSEIEAQPINYEKPEELQVGVKPQDHYLLVPKADNPKLEANRVKDRAMATQATQFMGFSAQSNPNQPSSTRDYARNWGKCKLANTGNYTNNDVIMVSGSSPWRGVTQEQIETVFQESYIPLLNKAIEAKATILVGDAGGTDQLIQKHLREQGYYLAPTKDGYLQGTALNLEPQLNPLPIAEKPVSMVFNLRMHDHSNPLPVTRKLKDNRERRIIIAFPSEIILIEKQLLLIILMPLIIKPKNTLNLNPQESLLSVQKMPTSFMLKGLLTQTRKRR